MIKSLTIVYCLVFLFWLPLPAYTEEPSVVIVTGTIIDETTKEPITDAIVSSDLDVSPVQSDKKGRFQFIVLSAHPFTVRVSRDGYAPFEKLLTPQNKVILDIRLKRQNIKIIFDKFKKGSFLSGRVEGLAASDLSEYKIIVYVLTDKWYIHPFAENKAGRGYALLGKDGEWSIPSVWRGYQAYKVAFLLVPKGKYTPATVIAAMPEQDLLAAVPHKTSLIIEAPEGI